LYFILFKLQASSIKSIALSGRYLSVINLVDKSTAACVASSDMFKLWYSSKISFIQESICRDIFSLGSHAIIFWNLLSSAESLSIYF